MCGNAKENASEQENVKDLVVKEKGLWELHRLFKNRKGNLSSTHKKNTEANTKVYDLDQKTMQALDVLAEEREIIEENYEENYARNRGGRHAVRGTVRRHGGARQHQKEQNRPQDELDATRESMDIVSREFTNCWAHLNTAFRSQRTKHSTMSRVSLQNVCQTTAELKRADDAHERTKSHKEGCRRATKEHTKFKAATNHSLGRSGWFHKETANATQSLTDGVPD